MKRLLRINYNKLKKKSYFDLFEQHEYLLVILLKNLIRLYENVNNTFLIPFLLQ